MSEFPEHDLRYVVQRTPKDIRDLMTANPKRLFLGGGFVRATIANETPSDIDLFGVTKAELEGFATTLMASRPGARIHRSKNAITLVTPDRLTVQFITRWTFDEPKALVESFDFTVCQAAIWRGGNQSNSPWRSCIGDSFYQDLAAKRLVYTSPKREEEAGGSLLRVLKYVKRGYSIQVGSLGAVLARTAVKLRDSGLAGSEEGAAQVITGLLREVDPSLVVDGFDVVDDHDEDAML